MFLDAIVNSPDDKSNDWGLCRFCERQVLGELLRIDIIHSAQFQEQIITIHYSLEIISVSEVSFKLVNYNINNLSMKVDWSCRRRLRNIIYLIGDINMYLYRQTHLFNKWRSISTWFVIDIIIRLFLSIRSSKSARKSPNNYNWHFIFTKNEIDLIARVRPRGTTDKDHLTFIPFQSYVKNAILDSLKIF